MKTIVRLDTKDVTKIVSAYFKVPDKNVKIIGCGKDTCDDGFEEGIKI